MIPQQDLSLCNHQYGKKASYPSNLNSQVQVDESNLSRYQGNYNLNISNYHIINHISPNISCFSMNNHQHLSDQNNILNDKPQKSKEKTKTKKMFTKEEDQKLINAVEQLQNKKGFCWTQVSEIVGGGRTSRQCRERYKHYLDPEIKNPKWTIEEDILLQKKYAEYGPKWTVIAKFFKSRTDVNVKNRWTILSQRIHRVLTGNYKNFSIPYVKTLKNFLNFQSKASNQKQQQFNFNGSNGCNIIHPKPNNCDNLNNQVRIQKLKSPTEKVHQNRSSEKYSKKEEINPENTKIDKKHENATDEQINQSDFDLADFEYENCIDDVCQSFDDQIQLDQNNNCFNDYFCDDDYCVFP